MYNIRVHGDVFGFDRYLEVLMASGGILLGHLKNVRKKVNANNEELAYAA